MFSSKSIDKEGIVALRVDVDGRHEDVCWFEDQVAGIEVSRPHI